MLEMPFEVARLNFCYQRNFCEYGFQFLWPYQCLATLLLLTMQYKLMTWGSKTKNRSKEMTTY